MGLHGTISLPGGTPQDLDLETVELFGRFFPLEDLIGTFQLHDLTLRELTILKAALLQELARQVAQQGDLRNAVKQRVAVIFEKLRPAPAEK